MSRRPDEMASLFLFVVVKEIVEVKQDTTAIIGAGPYGLSEAAHFKARKIPALIFGKPIEFWQNMPPIRDRDFVFEP